MSKFNDATKENAERAVGSALLFRESPHGGSYGNGIDRRRAKGLAAEHLDGEQLYELLMDVAMRAGEHAQEEIRHQRYRIVTRVRELAETTDSLSLHRFIEHEAKS
jgi:hypothetical protein